jgi:predicted dehydrogenase
MPPGTIRWGVVATGGIAAVVTGDLQRLPDAEVLAVSSRDIRRAESFAAAHGIPRAYGDYPSLLDDPDVDVVYVATPHSQHHEVSKAALVAGKHVLCEKPIALEVGHAEELADLARRRGLFLLEGMWTRFNPLIRTLRRLVGEGVIGEVRSVRADFGFAQPYDPEHRLWNPALGGGALYDLGVYPVAFAHMLLGAPESVTAHGRLAANGVDADAGLMLRYPGGAHALLGCSLISPLAVAASVVGTKGRIELPEMFYRPTVMTAHIGDESETYGIDLDGEGFTYQLTAVMDGIRAGAVESPEMRHDDTIAVLRTLVSAVDGLGARPS